MKTFVQLLVVIILIVVVASILSVVGKNREKNAFINECMAQKTYELCEQDYAMKKTENKLPSNMQVLEDTNSIYRQAPSESAGITGLDSL